jgi:hypothetical protein
MTADLKKAFAWGAGLALGFVVVSAILRKI